MLRRPLALVVLLLFGGALPNSGLAQRARPAPEMARPGVETREWRAPRPEPTIVPRSVPTPDTNRTVVRVAPHLDIDYLPSSESALGSTEYRSGLNDYVRTRFQTLASTPIDAEKIQIISLVPERDTDRVLRRRGLADRTVSLADAPAASILDELSRARGKLVVLVAHVDEATKTFGGVPIAELVRTSKESGTQALFLGCHTYRAIGSGATDTVNSTDVFERVATGLTAITVGQFFATLAGPELPLRIDLQLIEGAEQTLRLFAPDKVAQSIGPPDVTVVAIGFPRGPADAPKADRLSAVSVWLKIPFAILAFAIGFSTPLFMALLVALSAPVFAPMHAVVFGAWRFLCGLGYVIIMVVGAIAALLTAVGALVLFAMVMPDHTIWVPIMAIPLFWLAAMLSEVGIPAILSAFERMPARLNGIVASLSVCVVSGLFTSWSL